MTHHVFLVGDMTEKRKVVRELASGEHRRLFFTRTKHHARRLAQELTENGIPAVEMHGNLSQNARERGLKAFANGSVRVMVATDVAARGIHVDDIDLVVHVDPPAEHKAYLHRSGRTARAGRTGDVVTLVLPSQRRDFRSIARAAKITAEPARVSSGDDAVVDLVGTPAAPVSPDHAPVEAAGSTNTAPQRKPKQRRSRPDTAPTGRRRSRPATPRGDWSERRRDGRERSEERRGERVRRDVADRERGEREYGDRTSSPSRRTYSPDEQAGTRKPRHAAGKKQGTGKGKGYRHSDASDQRFSKGGRSASGRSGSTPRQGRQGRRDGGRGTYAAA
jgi:superfamily II DNA/RNA helicase